MAKVKKIIKVVKVQAMGGAATPAPPLGPALGQAGVDIGGFVKQFNDQTQDRKGKLLPVVITVFEDRSFTFKVKTPPAASLIKEMIKLEKGSGEANKKKVGKINRKQLEEIAKIKMEDLNANDLDAAVRIIAGTAKSLGVTVEGV
ncbi:MAG TPA: 50S ribosomal protein L11 [Candidatus Peribacterales bacterium]|nr:50S ribosomal protein L11 [Candidatus Peribacterales bacterium]